MSSDFKNLFNIMPFLAEEFKALIMIDPVILKTVEKSELVDQQIFKNRYIKEVSHLDEECHRDCKNLLIKMYTTSSLFPVPFDLTPIYNTCPDLKFDASWREELITNSSRQLHHSVNLVKIRFLTDVIFQIVSCANGSLLPEQIQVEPYDMPEERILDKNIIKQNIPNSFIKEILLRLKDSPLYPNICRIFLNYLRQFYKTKSSDVESILGINSNWRA